MKRKPVVLTIFPLVGILLVVGFLPHTSTYKEDPLPVFPEDCLGLPDWLCGTWENLMVSNSRQFHRLFFFCDSLYGLHSYPDGDTIFPGLFEASRAGRFAVEYDESACVIRYWGKDLAGRLELQAHATESNERSLSYTWRGVLGGHASSASYPGPLLKTSGPGTKHQDIGSSFFHLD